MCSSYASRRVISQGLTVNAPELNRCSCLRFMKLSAHQQGPSEKGLPLLRPLAGVLPAKRKDAELRPPEDPRPPPVCEGSSDESRASASGVSADAGEASGDRGAAVAPECDPASTVN